MFSNRYPSRGLCSVIGKREIINLIVMACISEKNNNQREYILPLASSITLSLYGHPIASNKSVLSVTKVLTEP